MLDTVTVVLIQRVMYVHQLGYFIFLFLLAMGVNAIYCYNCADSIADRPCQTSLKDMVNEAKCITNPNNTMTDCHQRFTVNCSDNKPYCLIEKIESRGKKKILVEVLGLSWFMFMVFNATVSNISVIWWRNPEYPEKPPACRKPPTNFII